MTARLKRIAPPPDPLDLRDLEGLQLLFDDLVGRRLPDDDAVLTWLEDWSTLYKRIYDAGNLAKIEWTRSTKNKRRRRLLRIFQGQVMPIVRLAENELNRRLVGSGWTRSDMVQPIKRIRMELEIFCEPNIPLLSADDELGVGYGDITGDLVADFDGAPRTVVQLTDVYLKLPDRSVREDAWRLSLNLYAGVRDQIEKIYDEMVALRHRIGTNAGFPGYTEFRWRELGRDYTVADCLNLHAATLATVVPAVARRMEARKRILNLDTLRPWDVMVDPHGDQPLLPFSTGAELALGMQRVFASLDPALGQHIGFLVQNGLLDLENRPGKNPGGYQETLYQRGWPFIFMNATGSSGDLQVAIHEGGHAVHALINARQPLFWQQLPPIEFAEVASMGAELMVGQDLTTTNGGPYTYREHLRARIEFLDSMLRLLPWITIVDAQQHWVYANPGHSRADRAANWRMLHEQFMVGPDWTGFEEHRGFGWHGKLHFFQAPLYYIEYMIAWFGALQVWRNWRQDPARGLAMWLDALALGGTADLPTLFRTAGAELVFAEGQMAPLVQLMIDEIEDCEHKLLSMPA